MPPNRRPSPQTPLPRGEGLSCVPVHVGILAIALRKRETPAERRLWRALRNRGLADLKFRRQHPIGRYVLDFYCHERQLAIELDGFHHFSPERRAYDAERSRFLQAIGVCELRIVNTRIMRHLDAVLHEIARSARDPSPQPLSRRERGFCTSTG